MHPARRPLAFLTRHRGRLLRYAAYLAAIAFLAFLAWWLFSARPQAVYDLARKATDDSQFRALEAHDEALKTGAQLFLGIAVIFGAVLTWRRVRALEKQADVAYHGQLTERFTRAIEHLGNDKPAICLGGIYALERIARDSPRDHPQIIEVLCAFVREETRTHLPFDPVTDEVPPLSTTVQAALDVIGRNSLPSCPLKLTSVFIPGAILSHFDFSFADLSNANLAHSSLASTNFACANLTGAKLAFARLTGANLTNAHLRYSDLSDASFLDANLVAANLSHSDLSRANLTAATLARATLARAKLFHARLTDADLAGADLAGADLRQAIDIPDLSASHLSSTTKLPPNLTPHPDPGDPAPTSKPGS